jgi:hypothetical protein
MVTIEQQIIIKCKARNHAKEYVKAWLSLLGKQLVSPRYSTNGLRQVRLDEVYTEFR